MSKEVYIIKTSDMTDEDVLKKAIDGKGFKNFASAKEKIFEVKNEIEKDLMYEDCPDKKSIYEKGLDLQDKYAYCQIVEVTLTADIKEYFKVR